jgi:hypothetical protein
LRKAAEQLKQATEAHAEWHERVRLGETPQLQLVKKLV